MKKTYIIIGAIFLIALLNFNNIADFFQKGVKCDSEDAKNLASKIIKEKILPRYSQNTGLKFFIDDISLKDIIVKDYNRETGQYTCKASAIINGQFAFPNKNFNTENFLKNTMNTDEIVNTQDDTYTITAPINYTTELILDSDKFSVNVMLGNYQ